MPCSGPVLEAKNSQHSQLQSTLSLAAAAVQRVGFCITHIPARALLVSTPGPFRPHRTLRSLDEASSPHRYGGGVAAHTFAAVMMMKAAKLGFAFLFRRMERPFGQILRNWENYLFGCCCSSSFWMEIHSCHYCWSSSIPPVHETVLGIEPIPLPREFKWQPLPQKFPH